MSAALANGSGFRRRVVLTSCYMSAPALAIVLVTAWSMLELSPENWKRFAWIVAVYAAVLTPITAMLQGRFMAPIARWLDGRAEGAAVDTPGAFHAIMRLPMRSSMVGGVSWVVSSVFVAVVMNFAASQWEAYDAAVLLLAGNAAGFVCSSLTLFAAKWAVAPEREAIASALPDPDERERLAPRISLRAKLLGTITGVTLVPVIFAIMLSQSQTARSLEAFALDSQRGVVDAMVRQLRAGRAAGQLVPAAASLRGLLSVSVIDLEAPGGVLDKRAIAHLRAAVAQGEVAGDSHKVRSEHVFTWQRLDGSQLVVAAAPQREIAADASLVSPSLLLLLLGSTLTAGLLAYLLSRDVAVAVEALRGEAERLSAGDLRAGRLFESEDELGALWRTFQKMAENLRDTVGSVARAADRVESTAREMSGVAGDVASVTASQVAGIQQVTSSMEGINDQVRGIAESSQALNVSVEESSSTILELGAAGEELNETASELSSRVDEVSTSIEQMVRSVRQVSENTEALSDAASDTSTSMEEMAASMREVNTSAEETGRLSEQVVDTAESGQEKVRQTIDGMDAIREATETAETVIRSLGSRTKEIGAIVDVIDDVADETNLLALNAAIIAAQAGEHGRAFSVVADEIKDLADRVLASTKEIGSLISAVQEESTNATGAIESGSASVASGVDLSAEAGISLEEITRTSRDSGSRIGGIVSAVREQARAASHVVELMERVRTGVDQIRAAAGEQDRGNEVVYRSAVAMREVAQQVRGTTEEQSRGSGRIRESVEEIRSAVEQINEALQEQSASCRSAVEFLEDVYRQTESNEASSKRLDVATRNLQSQAATLRESVHRFKV